MPSPHEREEPAIQERDEDEHIMPMSETINAFENRQSCPQAEQKQEPSTNVFTGQVKNHRDYYEAKSGL